MWKMGNSPGTTGIAKFLRGEAGRTTGARLLLWTVVLAWLAWISSPFLLLGRLGYVRSFELGDAVYPQVAYIVRMLQAGHFSLWLPAQGSGTDLLGNFNSPYLNVILYVLWPTWLAHSLIITIVIVASAFSTAFLLRRSFNCSMPIACAGGFLYGSWFLVTFGGLVLAYAAGLAFALAPLILDRLLHARALTLRDAVLSVLLGVVFAIGGHYTWSVFILAVDFICVAALAPHRLLRWGPHLGIITITTAILHLPVILANLQTASLSARTFEIYYRWNALFPVIQNYSENPSFSPYGELVFACALCTVVAMLMSSRRAGILRLAWPALAFALLFFLLPALDALVLYILSLLRVAGFSLDPNGDFGGPFDCRLRMSRAFVASVAAALAGDLFWREVLSGNLAGLRDGIVCRRRGDSANGTARQAAAAREGRRLGEPWSSTSNKMNRVRLRQVSAAALVAAVACGAIGEALHVFGSTATTLQSMRRMAVDGLNFSAYYRHPQLLELASRNPDVETYRVATVLLNGPDVTGEGPCCETREASFSGGFQTAYGFEIADAYMSNLTRRSVDFWDLIIAGVPGFPRADFNRVVQERFLLPQHAFTQKLYLFQPIGTGQVSADGCIRPQNPVEFAANYNLDMLSLDNVKFIISAFPLKDRRLTLLESKLREELGALQCATKATRLAAFRADGLAGRPLFIYRNEQVIPRVFAPQAVEIVDDERMVYRAMVGRSAAELKRTALVVREDLPASLADPVGDLQVSIGKISVLRGDHLQIETSSGTAGILIVSDSYSPFWQAEAGGKALPVFPAYHTFIGIAVPSGRQMIDLRYRPPYAKYLGYGSGR